MCTHIHTHHIHIQLIPEAQRVGPYSHLLIVGTIGPKKTSRGKSWTKGRAGHITPALLRLRWEGYLKFQASLGYTEFKASLNYCT